MKTASDPRHQRRRRTVQILYTFGFRGRVPKSELAARVVAKIPKIDKIIARCAPEWPIAQINRIDLAILRLAVFELNIEKKEPPKVIIDEAVEIAKEFGSEASPSFINGVLGSALKERDGRNSK